MSIKGVNFKLSATNAAGPAFSSFNRGMASVRGAAVAAQAPMRSWNAGLNAQRRAVQQFGFQMSDFAIQIAGGQSAMLAFTQQGGQMLQFFGPAGAILAALVAVFGSLYIGITRSGVAMDQLYPYLGALEDDFRGLVDAIRGVVGAVGGMARFIVAHLDVIIIAMGLVVGWFAIKWVSAVVIATVTTGAFSNVLRATALSFHLAGTGAAAATLATSALTGAMYLLRLALIYLGLPALVIAAAYLVERFVTLARGAGSFGNALRLVADVARASFSAIGDYILGLWQNFIAMTNGVAADWTRMLNSMIGGFMDFTWEIADGLNAMFKTDIFSGAKLGPVTQQLELVAREFDEKSAAAAAAAEGHFTGAAAGIKTAWGALKDALAAGEINSPLPDWSKAGEDGGKGGGGGGGKCQVARAKEEADKIKEVFEDMQKSISDSMLAGFKALFGGAKSFGEAARDILGSILDKVIDLLMTPVFNSIAGGIAGGIFKGLGSIGIKSFAGGGYTGSGSRSGGLDGKGGRLAMLHPQETVIDHARGQSVGGAPNVTINFDARGSDTATAQRLERFAAEFETRVVKAVMSAQKRRVLK